VTPSDISLCDEAASFLQSGFWGTFKASFGWEALPFAAVWKDGVKALLLLRRRLGPGISFAYVPWGPELPEAHSNQAEFPPEFPGPALDGAALLSELARALRPFLPRDTAFIRFDPPWYSAAAAPEIGGPLKRAAADIQPPDTVLVDLRAEESAILGTMKPKCRYNIGLAEKKGLRLSRPDGEGLKAFYDLLTETAERDGIAVHGFDYYRRLFELSENPASRKGPELRLYTAVHEGETLAAIVVLIWGKQAVYLYGASSNSKRNLMAPYALQWRAMRDAKRGGCAVYDLFGIPPNDDPSHPMAGLYRFKTGFGGTVIHRPGSWDYAYRPFLSTLFTKAEHLRKSYRDRKKNRK
jgi:lipid II:glycine glycyltransferase (peptidoglycan interpeptide bridge formation enzyme)